MNKFESATKPLMWLMGLLLLTLMAGCSNGGNSGSPGVHLQSSAKTISTYSLAGSVGTINETAKIITVNLPYGTSLTALVATFTTTGTSVKVGTTAQVSGVTTNGFTNTVSYIVTAPDDTTVTYSVLVTVSTASAKSLSAFSISGRTGIISGTATPFAIALTVPYGTNVTASIATFTWTGASVKVGTTGQTSGTTPNDFTSPVVYTVTAADGSTAIYTVTVSKDLITANAISAFSFAGYSGATGVITGSASPFAIAVSVPQGTDRTTLKAIFVTDGHSVTVGTSPAVTQVSGTTQNNFTTPVAYIVTAADLTTQATYNVTVSFNVGKGPTPINLLSIATNNFVVLATTTITDTGSHSSAITGNIGVSPAAGSFMGGVFCSEMTGTIYGVDATYVGSGAAGCYLGGGAYKTLVDNAVADQGTAYTAVTGSPAGVGATNLNLLSGNIPAGTTFAPGTYTWGSDLNINGDITLAGGSNDVWIFQTSGKLHTAAKGSLATGTHVILSGGAVASNVFWQVGGADVTLGTYSTFYGVILTSPSTLIAIQTGTALHGRALSGTAVSLDANPVGP